MADVAEVLLQRSSSGEADAVPTSLVTEYGTNAHKPPWVGANKKRPACPTPVLFVESCGHGNERPWLRPCDKWTCDSCCSWRVETEIVPELVRALAWAKRKGLTLKFITPTWRGTDLAADTTKAAAERRRKDVAHFVQWFRRKYGFFEYERFAENHKSGKIHFHMVAVCDYVAQVVLSEQWKKHARGAFRMDIEAVGLKCPRCWPGPGATRAEKRASMIVPPPGSGECRRCGYTLDWTDPGVYLDVAKEVAKELGKYLSKSVPMTYLVGKGRRQPISRSKGWLKECGPEQPDPENEPPCNECGVEHAHVPVRRDDYLREHYLGVAVDGAILWHNGQCNCWRGLERARSPTFWVVGVDDG